MASHSEDMDELCKKFKALTGKDGDQFKSMSSAKFLKEYMPKYKGISQNDLDINVMPELYKDETKKAGKSVKYFTINPTNCEKYLSLTAKLYHDKSKSKDDVETIKGKMLSDVMQHDVKKKAVATSGVTDRLTDTSKYTGAHKERFDEGGKGKGIKGREDIAQNTGYVGNYKNEGSYDKKK